MRLDTKETRGGYTVTDFRELTEEEKNEVDRLLLFSWKPLYCGTVTIPKVRAIPDVKVTRIIYWNENGECANSLREDCYLKINTTENES